MPVRSLRSISPSPRVWIPTTFNVYYKVTIVDDGGTTNTVADTYGGAAADNFTLSAKVTRPVTSSLANFSLKLANDNGRFLNKFNGGEVISIFADNTDATTLIFRGKVDNVKYGVNVGDGFSIELDGRDYPELVDKTIVGTEVSVTADVSLAGILDEFFSDITLLYWNGSSWSEATYNSGSDTVSWSPGATGFPTTLINMSYQHKKGWSVIREICERAGLDCYMEYDVGGSRWTLRIFNEQAISNSNAGIAYGINLMSLNEYGVDNNEITNRVAVYGRQESENIVLLKSEDDITSQSNLWIKDSVVQATDLISMDEVQDKADVELSKGIQAVAGGRATVVAIPEVRPGNMVTCSVPYTGMNGSYKVQEFTHTFDNRVITNVELTKKVRKIKDIFTEKVNPDDFLSGGANLNGMKDSYTIYFSEASSKMSHLFTEESGGRLQLQTGASTGTATSETLTSDFDSTECEFRRFENYSVGNDTYQVSNTGGATWENYTADSGDTHTFAVAGDQIKFRMRLSRAATTDASPAYESVVLLYK